MASAILSDSHYLLFVEVAGMAGGAELVASITGTHQGASRSESLVVSRKFLLFWVTKIVFFI